MTTAVRTPPHHNNLTCYHHYDCRLPACVERSRNWGRNRNRQAAYGTWQPYVDAEPVRAHVRQLMAYGLGWQRIADQAGVSRGTVEKLIYGAAYRGMGPSKRIRPETVEKLLAVQPAPDRLGAVAAVDATGTHRRIHALAAAGWPLSHLCARLGINRGNLGRTLRGTHVRISTDRAVRALYDQLWNLDPLEHGVSLHSYNRAHNHARINLWAPVGAWDDDQIDNPEAFPDWTGQCGTPAGVTAHYRHHIPVCTPCRSAAAQARRERGNAA